MRRNPGFEPSVWSVLNAALPDRWRVIGGADQLQLRVSYPLVMRTTGLGRIEGGELVLVPPNRAGEVLAGARDLCETGISGVVLVGVEPESLAQEQIDCAAPVVTVEAPADLQVIRDRINRYIVRRRRELYALEQRLHRRLVDAAIAGVGMDDLLQKAAEETRSVVVLDRGGELQVAPVGSEYPSQAQLTLARRALDRENDGRFASPGPPRMLSLEVAGGGERRGLVAAFGLLEERQEEDEAVMAALVSAVSIVLTRAPAIEIPPLEGVFTRRSARSPDGFPPDARWSALAVRADDILPETLQRVVSAESDGRGMQYLLAESGEAYVVLSPNTAARSWEAFLAALQARSRVPVTRAGVGRAYVGLEGAVRSAREAVRALDHATAALTYYADVEVTVLLLSLAEGADFVRTRLGPLLDGSPAQRELLETMRVYLATGKNAKEAARRLAVHRNTLLYRLRRAQELLGLDWDDADAVFGLDLALRLLALPRTAVNSGAGTD